MNPFLKTGILLTIISLSITNCWAKNICDSYITNLALKANTSQPLPRNIREIEQHLGQKKPNVIYQTQYSWKKFTILVRNDQIVKIVGDIPPIYRDAITTPTLEEAVMSLGQPVQGPRLKLNQYWWICNEGYGSVLNAYAYQNGTLVSIDGLVCTSNISNCSTYDSVKFNVDAFRVSKSRFIE